MLICATILKIGIDGFVVSDWGSINEMIAHGYAKRCAAETVINAGSEVDSGIECLR
jgi:beta-glucosidase-like glycosyl hydrolase